MFVRSDCLATATALLLAFAVPANANVCDDVDTVASDWLAISDSLEGSDGDENAELDLAKLQRDVNALLGPTEELGRGLAASDNAEAQELGNDLLDVTGQIREVESQDRAIFLVDRIEDIIETLDDAIVYCADAPGVDDPELAS